MKFQVKGYTMRKGYYEDISTFLVKHSFHLRFFLSRLTRKSGIFKKIIERLLFQDDEIFVLPNNNFLNENSRNGSYKKDSAPITTTTISADIEINQSFQKDDSLFLPVDLLKEAVKRASYIVTMNQCLCRRSNDCQDYPQDLGCIFLGPAARNIPEKYGRQATVEEAFAQIDYAESVGLSHVMGRNKIDTIWMNVGPKEELLTICHCCPCCCLWKVLPDIHPEISEKVMRLEGVNVKTKNDQCILCKKCLGDDVCFGGAIYLDEAENKIRIRQKQCIGCGHCVHNCPKGVFDLSYTQESLDYVLDRMDALIDYR